MCKIICKLGFLFYLPFVFIVSMSIHNYFLKRFAKYDAKRFKLQYRQDYQHIFGEESRVGDNNMLDGYRNVLLLPPKQPHVIIVPTWYDDVMNKKLASIFMSVFVLSAPKNFQNRNNTRREFNQFIKTYNHSQKHMNKKALARLTFLIGNSENHSIESKLIKECDEYGDILKMNINESYTNIVYKLLNSFEWAARIEVNDTNTYVRSFDIKSQYSNLRNNFASNITNITSPLLQVKHKFDKLDWIVKVDDDMSVNYVNLINSLEKETESRELGGNEMSILCSSVLNNNVPQWRNDSITRKW